VDTRNSASTMLSGYAFQLAPQLWLSDYTGALSIYERAHRARKRLLCSWLTLPESHPGESKSFHVLKQLSFYDVLVCFTAALCRATSQLAENQPQILFCCMVCATLFSTIAWMVRATTSGLVNGRFSTTSFGATVCVVENQPP
jgi:hypothetical protein